MSLDEDAATGWYSNDAATFGDRVAAARDALGLSEVELAERLGIKVKTLRAWEDDLSEPRANKLQMLAGVLNVSFRWLLTGEGEGLRDPQDAVPHDITALLAELRALRGQVVKTAEQIGVLEKRLSTALRDNAA
ncbi:MAG: helix-turn-helix domain-containing protein [Alphaproteobacteria bacterium]|nr:helix-turn-helix domain-containing protein [Alphaproteobacteria bacterium]NNF24057.1 helix-turn-helix transcriptional regulator [Paracoccaceae bacterium]